ncbi:MAG: YdeI family protein [Hyphomicrobiales bacterium]
MKKKEVKEFCPKNEEEWREWLNKYHKTESSVWLIVYKKESKVKNLNWSQSVDQALCFGWIDSTKRRIDNERYKQYFSKRKAKSTWSVVNKNKVDVLIRNGLMTEEGMKAVELAKSNGSWSGLDDIEKLIIPEDLQKALDMHPKANTYFESLSKSVKKGMLYWVTSAKREETRLKRINEIAICAGEKKKPKIFK